jgi:hypothetical protein
MDDEPLVEPVSLELDGIQVFSVKAADELLVEPVFLEFDGISSGVGASLSVEPLVDLCWFLEDEPLVVSFSELVFARQQVFWVC